MCLVRKFDLKTYVVVRTPLRVASHSGRFTHKENKYSSWCVNVQQPLRQQLHVLPTQCNYVSRVIITANSDHFREQHELLGLCNGHETVFSVKYAIILKYYRMNFRIQLRWPRQVAL